MSSQTVTDSGPRLITTSPPSQRSDRRLPERVQRVGSDEAAGFVLDWELPNHPSEGTPARTGREASARENRSAAGGAHGPAAIGSSGPSAGVNASVAAPLPVPPGSGPAGVSPHDLDPSGPGEAPATTRPVLSVTVTREMSTVVVTLEGLLDKDGSSAVTGVLWDLVVGQGNLSVAVDVRRLSLCDPSLMAFCMVLEREAAGRGGTVTVVKPSPPRASANPDRAAASLELRRARRAAQLGMADHPAGGARNTLQATRGAQHEPT